MCDSYVIRIYSNIDAGDKQNSTDVVGVIESTHNQRRIAFHDKDELWTALLSRFGHGQDGLSRDG